jgi:hypothetical protein
MRDEADNDELTWNAFLNSNWDFWWTTANSFLTFRISQKNN